jgi:hypothetical protein
MYTLMIRIAFLIAFLLLSSFLAPLAKADCGDAPSLTLLPLNTTSEAGYNLTYTVKVTNNDCVTKEYAFSVGSGGSYYPYPTIENPSPMKLTSGQTGSVDLDVGVPSGAKPNDVFTVSVTAYSCNRPSCWASATSTITVVDETGEQICIEEEKRDAICSMLGCYGYGAQ